MGDIVVTEPSLLSHPPPQLVRENTIYGFLTLMKSGIADRPEETQALNRETQSVALLSPEAIGRARLWVAVATMWPIDQTRPAAPSSSSRTRLSVEAVGDQGVAEQYHCTQNHLPAAWERVTLPSC